MIRADVRRAFSSFGFWATMAGICIAGLLLGLENIATANLMQMNSLWPQHMMAMMLTITSDVFILLIPVLSTFAFSSAFIEEYSAGFTKYSLMRASKNDYSASKTLAVIASGGLPVLIGLAILILVFYISVPTIYNTGENYSEQYYMFFIELITLAVNGALWSVVGSLSATVTKNRYIAFAFPFVFFYVLSVFQTRYYPDLLLLNPTEIMRTLVYIGSVEIGLIVSLIALGILAFIHYLCIRNKLKNV